MADSDITPATVAPQYGIKYVVTTVLVDASQPATTTPASVLPAFITQPVASQTAAPQPAQDSTTTLDFAAGRRLPSAQIPNNLDGWAGALVRTEKTATVTELPGPTRQQPEPDIPAATQPESAMVASIGVTALPMVFSATPPLPMMSSSATPAPSIVTVSSSKVPVAISVAIQPSITLVIPLPPAQEPTSAALRPVPGKPAQVPSPQMAASGALIVPAKPILINDQPLQPQGPHRFVAQDGQVLSRDGPPIFISSPDRGPERKIQVSLVSGPRDRDVLVVDGASQTLPYPVATGKPRSNLGGSSNGLSPIAFADDYDDYYLPGGNVGYLTGSGGKLPGKGNSYQDDVGGSNDKSLSPTTQGGKARPAQYYGLARLNDINWCLTAILGVGALGLLN